MKKFFYKTKDGLHIKAYQYGRQLPTQTVIIYLRGGNNHPVHKGSMELILEDFTKSWLQNATKKDNCIVYATDYRGSLESDGVDDVALHDLGDIMGLLDWVKKNHDQPSKILLYAESMGVYKALSFFSKFPRYRKEIDAIIFKAGVYNLQAMKSFRPLLFDHWKNDYSLTISDIKKRDNTINPKNFKKIPILLFHGTGDKKASINEMYNFLMQLGMNYSLEVFRNGDHGLSNFQKAMYQKIKSFLLV